MEIKFTKNGEKFVSEFTATADFNLHLEGVVEGKVKVYQRSTAEGEYAYVRAATPYPSFSKVYDYDFSALVYPKYIKVVTDVEPEYAEVVTDGEVIPSAGGGSRNIKYYDLSGAALDVKQGMPMYALMMKYNIEESKVICGFGQLLNFSMNDSLSGMAESAVAGAFDFDAVFVIGADGQMKTSDFITPELIAELGLTEITEEEFYNLN